MKKKTRITDIIVDELSTVDKAANGRRFLLYKRAEKMTPLVAACADAARIRGDLAPLVKMVAPQGVAVGYDMFAVKRMLTPGA